MTTTEPSRAASPVPSTSSSPSQAPCSAWPPLACLQRRKEKLCRTDLPVRSAPGVWLLVGVGVVLVGMCVAVAGYASASSAPKPLQGGRGTSHSERMKLAGPVVMGVGLFIFICSATLLYENRDSALLTLRPAGPGDGAPVLGDEEEGCSPRRPCCSCRDRRHRPHRRCSGDPEQGSWASSLSLAPSLCGDHSDEDHDDVDPGSSSPGRGHGVIAVSLAPGGQGGGQGESPDSGEAHGGGGGGGGGAEGQQVGVMVVEVEVEEVGGGRLLTCVVHHQEPPGPSSQTLPSSTLDSCNSSEIDFDIRTLLTPPLP
ncbi:uncharacterized protein LOC132459346 [Gadus macrocephalus]|uniref:uncharacterized protein LOC132459346 n=1 Tax=Gadus macrocephalus TaxID=80720 RepID=UPI0028CB369F|nr:uncharacterized protein LOC132459346 [Gadus macrocephalus]